MGKKLKSVACLIMVAITVVLLLTALGGLIIILSKDVFNAAEVIKYTYLAIGEVLIPIELLIKRGLGVFTNSSFEVFSICTFISIILICLFIIRDLLKARKSNDNKFHLVSSYILMFLIILFFGFSIIMTGINSGTILNYLTQIDNAVILRIIIIKNYVLPALYITGAIFTFYSLIAGRNKTPKTVTVVENYSGINFYTSDFEEPVKEVKAAEKQEKQEGEALDDANISVKEKDKSQKLLEKIMELNEMKDNGEISAVEYTRLRQKAIRRYKK